MSEVTPALFNMSADVASATGLNPISGQAPATTGNNGHEFANVLQTVLNPALQQSNPNNPVLANPRLFAQLGDSVNPLLTLGNIDLEALPAGNSLPAGEQEFAWQTLMAEDDSTDPDSPHVVLASGDVEGSEIEEFAVDDLIPLRHLQDTDKQGTEDLPEQDAQAANLEKLIEDNISDASNEPLAVSPGVLAAVHEQNVVSAAKPAMAGGEEDVLSKLAKTQPAGAARLMNSVHTDANTLHSETQIEGKQLFQEKIERLMGHGKLENMETVSNKFDSVINAASEQAAAIKPAPQTGVSTYAAVSGLASSNLSSPSSAPIVAQMTVPPQNPAWGDTVGDRVQWMASQNIQEAKIRLHPQELGLLEVHIKVGKDHQTTIVFSSPHSQVRDALEIAIPRLREMFGENGLSLGDVNVSQHSSSEQGHAHRDDKPASSSPSGNSISTNDSVDVAPPQQFISQGNSMLDLYA